ncbi:hypothetical protein S-PM2d208 [Synechococcus phage S-PM2]|uniref:Hypothetical-Protein / belonging to T4-LIKE GC: 727 n=1 Tax=Synechococcus phage S-PM2 TaxID=238854 RepID=Q5GQC9_BPSYP|nr:Hypothetical-Protein / belonging to T4-LIKE GC: 727 [Synechococcus phage S-PM2]CAF34273.1 Hypothetical-Protein / belonging to T4-LIKE GC: 727 [Synechococcus phage S-PM2]CFW42435.1 hypothetical protein S-PM2d208 [Synechococcus phage S-PM2]
MAASTESYQSPQYGSLTGAIGEKIGSAISMAAGARKRQNDEIEKLQNKSEKTPEEEQRLQDLLEQKSQQKKGYFFKKALGSEFGGDRLRRTRGFFSTNPEAQNDPALTKQKRFDALVAAQAPQIQRVKQTELDLTGAGYKEKSTLGKFSDSIAEKFNILGKKVDNLIQKEDNDKTPSVIVKMSESIRGVKSFFTRNNKIQEESNKINEEQLEQQIESANDAERAREELDMEARNRNAGGEAYDNKRKKSASKNILEDVLDFFDFPDLDFDRKRRRTGRSRRRGTRRRYARRKLNRFKPKKPNLRMPKMPKGLGRLGRGLRGFKGLSGGILGGIGMDMLFPDPTNQYDQLFGENAYYNDPNYKGPKPPKKLASGGVINVPDKLASGGILDNPTQISGPSAVVPQQKLASQVKTNPENIKKSSPFAKAIQLPTIAAGSLMLSTIANVINSMGGLSRLFRPVIQKLITPAASVFGLPASIISSIFGGPASAATMKGGSFGGFGRKKEGQSQDQSQPAGAAPATPGAGSFMTGGQVTGGGSISGYQITSRFGRRASPGGVGSTNHMGIDYGTPQGTKLAIKKPGRVQKIVVPAPGNMGEVHIVHDDGTETRYLHLSKVAVRQGAQVVAGTLLGETGGEPGTPGAGPSTGPHLHFEYYPSASSGPVDGSGVADQYFTVGGQVQSPGQPALPMQPPGSPSTPAPSAPPTGQPQIASPIFLPSMAQKPPAMPLSATPMTSPWSVYNFENPYQPHKF